jgi:hypothetical protein
MKTKPLRSRIAAGCIPIVLAACAPAPARPPSLFERCRSVMHEAWRDDSLQDVPGNAILNFKNGADRTSAVLQIPATVAKPDGARREIYLKCTFDHNVLVELQWEDQQTWP